jgi:hypothetical protein
MGIRPLKNGVFRTPPFFARGDFGRSKNLKVLKVGYKFKNRIKWVKIDKSS